MIVAVGSASGTIAARMGRPAGRCPWATEPFWSKAITALGAGGVDRIVAAIAPHVADLAELIVSAGAEVCRLSDATSDMRATVEECLRWVEERFDPCAADAFLLAPGDQLRARSRGGPLLFALPSAAIRVDRLLFRSMPVVAATRSLIGWGHVAGIRSMLSDRGINAYLRDHAKDIVEIAAADDSVLCDMDTPDDYSRLCRRINDRCPI